MTPSVWAGDEVEARPTVGFALDVRGKDSKGRHLYFCMCLDFRLSG